MLRLFLILSAIFLLIGPAEGRIGDTEAQVRARYGEAIALLPARSGEPGITKCYAADGYIISVTWVGGRSVREILTKTDRSKLSESEIRNALKANAGPAGWSAEQFGGSSNTAAGVQQWRTSDAGARVAFYDAQTRALFIATQQFIDLTKLPKRPSIVRPTSGGFGGINAGRPARNMKLFDQSAGLPLHQGNPQPSASPGSK